VSYRFKDYDGSLLSELANMQTKSPDVVHNALIKENFSLTDVVKLNRAMKQLGRNTRSTFPNSWTIYPISVGLDGDDSVYFAPGTVIGTLKLIFRLIGVTAKVSRGPIYKIS